MTRIEPESLTFRQIAPDVKLGRGVRIFNFTNLYGCEIGDDSKIGAFVEIQKGVRIGARCKVSSHTFICEGVVLEDEVFVGHNVTFINDLYPRSTTAEGHLQTEADWKCVPTLIKRAASIGSGATLLCGITVGERAVIGAGSVVTRDVPADAVVAGNPARILRVLDPKEKILTHESSLLNLKAHHDPLREQIDAAIREVIDANAFAGGPFVAAFEKEFAQYCGSKFSIGVGNGTDALWLSLLALEVGPGDEVITVPSTFMATAEAISYCGARPKFVDIEEQTYTMDPALLERAITARTKAIMPVHLFGQCADMDPILEVARKHGLPVVEDACQAHGALYKGRKAGTMGALGCFSYYPGKNLGAFGEAGGVTTDDKELAGRIQVFRDHGQHKKYYHSRVGWNARMDGIQGAVLSVKLKHLDVSNVRRHAHGMLYDQLLADVEEIITPLEAPHGRHIYHVYAVRVQERNQILQAMADKGISCAIHYPIPVHLQEAYRFLGYDEGSFPVAERCANEFLSLPMFPELTKEQIHAVATELKSCISGRKPQSSCLKT